MPRPRIRGNPIQTAVETWTATLPQRQSKHEWPAWRHELIKATPKRFTIYEPMALLPAGSLQSEIWETELAQHDAETVDVLWRLILEELSRHGKKQIQLTHLAVNEGIPLHSAQAQGEQNTRRSPSRLRVLFGDFGPAQVSEQAASLDSKQLDAALWVSTRQNGIVQTWAPRWTMFSRGNVKEKARLLTFACADQCDEPLGEEWAVDLYAGIGYFTFCYAALGFRVLGWEMNPWSVEGLRRGAHANGWTVRVVQGDELLRPLNQVLAGQERIIVFLESNDKARQRIDELQHAGIARNLSHVNCGLLPTSAATWQAAWHMTRFTCQSWLHLHENIGVRDIESRRQSVSQLFDSWDSSQGNQRVSAVHHVELVKTFAPDVWHCVLDVRITQNLCTSNDASRPNFEKRK
ncbi:hypothetical protein CDD82_7852 [Ophiocordyceps australis]|uniref:tRNA wybutosine-synthesizing protein 2 n=1 Tax=Ophiocordyceps australis TaxID=1399860 RepID=A0A2C5YQW3_9HYPO|nr:hypothetical protein CDD82_7852 [Ophiocordyceps australis]